MFTGTFGIFIPFIILALYFIPAIVAYRKKKRNQVAIPGLNLLLGWTVIGWITALIWATVQES